MQSVTRVLDVLSAVGAAEWPGVTLTELSHRLRLPLSTTHRIVAELAAAGFISRDPDTLGYVSGEKLVELVGRSSKRGAAEVVMPYLQTLTDRFAETSFFTMMIGRRAVCTAMVECDRPLRLAVRTGDLVPLHAAASARVLLAYMPVETATDLLTHAGLAKYTSETPTTVDDVVATFDAIRTRGYDVCENELDEGVWAVAVPILAGSRLVGSVTVAAPRHRVRHEDRRKEVTLALKQCVATLSRQQGFDPPKERLTGGRTS